MPNEDELDRLLDVLELRYGLTPGDLVDAVQWVKQRKKLDDRLRMAGIASLLALLVSAVAAALWEGVRSLLRLKGI